MVTKELRMAAAEINQILRYTEEMEVNKIPLGLRLFFKEIEDEKYIPDINPQLSLYDQKIMQETEQILGMIYCYYWSTEEELANMPEKVKKDAKEASKEIFQNYSPEELFEGAKTRRRTSLEQEALVEMQKDPWYKRLFGWFKKR